VRCVPAQEVSPASILTEYLVPHMAKMPADKVIIATQVPAVGVSRVGRCRGEMPPLAHGPPF